MIPDLYRSTERIRDYAHSVMFTSFSTTLFVTVAGHSFYQGKIYSRIIYTGMAIFDGVGVYFSQRKLRAELQKIDDFYEEIMDRLDKEHSKIKPGSFEDILLRLTADIPDTKPRE